MSSNAQSADGAKVVQLLDDIIAKANRSRASDIHITPRESRYQVRFRVDG
ncbi:MAG: type II secretion system protein GspE, partial [Deltaproteobacteria bacterium]|nr:type II secretion system protein GspE [Deltaproteobacteria bacterium]